MFVNMKFVAILCVSNPTARISKKQSCCTNNQWMLRISRGYITKVIEFLFKQRQSKGKVKLYFNVAGLLRKVYRGIAALLWKVAVNRPIPNYLWPLFQSESWC